MEKRESCSFNI